MHSRHDPHKDFQWDEIALMISAELDNAMDDYIKQSGAEKDEATLESISNRELAHQAAATVYARLINDEANALAIAWLRQTAEELADNR
jgi:hypothetical protein